MIPYQPILQRLETGTDYCLDVLRLDLIDPEISGNKWFKLKKNLEAAKAQEHSTIITFGGAFSNHIAATAAACKRSGFKSIGVIRGEAAETLNSTLTKAKADGMTLHFVSRDLYSDKTGDEFKDYLNNVFGAHYLIPEGGNNSEGMLGCREILNPAWDYDYVFCACGTGTTYAGLVSGKTTPSQAVIGISVLKGQNTLRSDAEALLNVPGSLIKIAGNELLEKTYIDQDGIINAYAFKGYAKYDALLVAFKRDFETTYNIPLDHIYTVKLAYAVSDLINKKKFKPHAKLLMIHSGGLQGNQGFEARYKLHAL